MSFFRSPRSPPPPPPPSLRTSSPTSVGSPAGSQAVSKKNSANRLTPPASPSDETDPAPFIAKPGDRVSLSQVLEPRELTPPLDDIADALQRPNLYRAATSFTNHEHSRTLYRELKSYRRGLGRPDGARSNSNPHTASEKAENILFSLSSADASRYSPESRSSDEDFGPFGDSPDSRTPTISSQDLNHAFEGFEGIQGLKRAHTHSGIPVPMEIRLRRASNEPTESRERKLSSASTVLPFKATPPPTTMRDDTGLRAPYNPSLKSTPAGTALTHTYVHLFARSDPTDERRASLSYGRRKLSATLQVVRSRDSVYEVIWEDEDIINHSQPSLNLTDSSSDDSENVEPQVSQPNKPKQHDQAPMVKTKMSKWSWGGELEPYSKSASGTRRSTIYATPPETHTPPAAPTPAAAETTPPAEDIVFAPIIESPPPSPPTSEPLTSAFYGEPSAPNEIEPMPRRGSSSRPPPSPFLGGTNLSVKQRRELLGNRKTSGIPLDQEHFSTHRDSLVLAHHRIFQEDLDKAASHVGNALAHGHATEDTRAEKGEATAPRNESADDPHVVQLKRDTWHRPRPPPSPPLSATSEQDEFVMPPTSPTGPIASQAAPFEHVGHTVSQATATKEHQANDGTSPKSIMRPGSTRTRSGRVQVLVGAETYRERERERSQERSKERRAKAKSDEWYSDALGAIGS